MILLLLSWILAFELPLSQCFQLVTFNHVRHNNKKHRNTFNLRFSPMNFDGSTKKNDVETADVERRKAEEEQNDSDISSFFQGLGQWPLYPALSEFTVQNEEEESVNRDEQNAYPRRVYSDGNPLSNLIKLEVILDLADGVKINETEQYFSSIISVADQLFRASNSNEKGAGSEGSMNVSNIISVGDLLQPDRWADPILSLSTFFEFALNERFVKTSKIQEGSAVPDIGQTAEAMVRVATSRLETIVNEASKGLSPNVANDLVLRAVNVFANGTTSVEQLAGDIVSVAQKVAKAQGLDVQYATERAKDATKGVSTIVNITNRVFGSGYAYGYNASGKSYGSENLDNEEPPLFADFDTARQLEHFQHKSVVAIGSVMGVLSGAVYEDAINRVHRIGHSLVANGTTADVAWMVTDSIQPSSMIENSLSIDADETRDDFVLVRTITIRGFDASDDSVDRERLLNNILKASETKMNDDVPEVLFHSGLLAIASEIYDDVKKYMEWASPDHKILLNGHSIGGSLSILLLFLITMEKGVKYVENRVSRVFTFGSPPIARLSPSGDRNTPKDSLLLCPILDAFGLSTSIVEGYVQPYDPIVRLFTEYDPLYPLVDDLGPDEITLYYSGPTRSLRPIARALFQAWEGWPEFRSSWLGANQQYQSIGVQHILLPEPLRYLNDRFFATNIGVPPVDNIVTISPSELLPALNETFPLDVFQISLVPQATRSFLHHFYPAYDSTMRDYARKVGKDTKE